MLINRIYRTWYQDYYYVTDGITAKDDMTSESSESVGNVSSSSSSSSSLSSSSSSSSTSLSSSSSSSSSSTSLSSSSSSSSSLSSSSSSSSYGDRIYLYSGGTHVLTGTEFTVTGSTVTYDFAHNVAFLNSPSTVISINCSSKGLDGQIDISNCSILNTLYCNDNSLSESAVDKVLSDLLDNAIYIGACNITENSVPSAQGISDAQNLCSTYSWTIEWNGGSCGPI